MMLVPSKFGRDPSHWTSLPSARLRLPGMGGSYVIPKLGDLGSWDRFCWIVVWFCWAVIGERVVRAKSIRPGSLLDQARNSTGGAIQVNSSR